MKQNELLLSQAFKKGWTGFKDNLLFFFLFFLGIAIIYAAVALAAYALKIREPYISNVLSVIIQSVFSTIISMALYRIALQIVDGKKPSWNNVFEDFNQFFHFFFGSFFYGIMVFVGLLLLVIPGIYWAVKYLFWGFNVIDKGMGSIESIQESGKQTEGLKWDLLGLIIITSLLNVIGVLCFVIGSFVTIPVTMIAWAYAYRKITAA